MSSHFLKTLGGSAKQSSAFAKSVSKLWYWQRSVLSGGEMKKEHSGGQQYKSKKLSALKTKI